MSFDLSKTVMAALVGLLLLTLATVLPAAAQSAGAGSPPLVAGQRIRVTAAAAPGASTRAVFQRLTADSLFAERDGGDPLALALSEVQALEVRRTDRARGAIYGAGIGAVLGTLMWMPTWCEAGHDKRNVTARDCLGMSLFYGVPTGGLVGAALGALSGTPRWRSVSIASALRLDPRARVQFVIRY